ncbi:hypothetical protein GE09DRAFT_692071 [Coniochaeta sp. 2T2.1]|nr:hypothetical protein GE09DRAFT_692071 [Coniochaeta sp. 2T2.1]
MRLNNLAVYKAHLVLEVIFSVAIIALAVLTFISRRRQHSHERRKGVKWLYFAMVFYAIAFIFGAAEFGLAINRLTHRTTSRDNVIRAYTQARVTTFAFLFRRLGDCAALCCIASITRTAAAATGSGKTTKPSSSPKIIYLATVALSFAVAGLSLAYFGGLQWVITQALRTIRGWVPDEEEYEHLLQVQTAFTRVSAALRILVLVVAVLLAGWTVAVAAVSGRRVGVVRVRDTALGFLVAAAVVNVVIHAWEMVSVSWALGLQGPNTPWYQVVEIVLDRFFTVVVLGLLYGVAKRPAPTVAQGMQGKQGVYVAHVAQP